MLDVRYLYGDRIKNGPDEPAGQRCGGFAGRRFVLAKTDAGFKVIEMSGPTRGLPPRAEPDDG